MAADGSLREGGKGELRQIVHLKLSAGYPAEVREAAVIREESGTCMAVLRVTAAGGVIEVTVPFAPSGELEVAGVEFGEGEDLRERFDGPGYEALWDALRQLSRSME